MNAQAPVPSTDRGFFYVLSWAIAFFHIANMSLIQQIANWLEHDRTFQSGLYLYLQVKNKNRNLVRRFMERGPNEYNSAKLVSELSKLVPRGFKIDQEQAVDPVIVTTDKIKTAKYSYIDRKFIDLAPNIPISIQKAVDERNRSYRERDFLHAQLEYVEKEERKDYAIRIMELTDIISECWRKIDTFKSTGFAPPGTKERTIENQYKRKLNLRTYIHKLKKKLQDPPTLKKKEQWMKKLTEYEEELKQIEDGADQ